MAFVLFGSVTLPCRLFTVRDNRVEEGILVRKYRWRHNGQAIDIPAIILERPKHEAWIVRVDLRDSFALWLAQGYARIYAGYVGSSEAAGVELVALYESPHAMTDRIAIVLYEDTQSLALVVNFPGEEQHT